MPAQPEDDLDAIPRGTRTRILIVMAVALVVALTLVWLLSGGGTEFIHRKMDLRTYLRDSAGVDPGAYVMVNGVRVGKVSRVILTDSQDPTRSVRIDLRIEERYAGDIPVDSIAAITADNLLGDQYVNITSGKSADHVTAGAEIASLVQNGSFNPADLVTSLQTTILRVDAILTEIQDGKTPTAQFVRGNEFYTSLRTQIESIEKTIQENAGPKTAAGRMLYSDDLYNQIRQPILNIDHALEEIQRGESRIGKFLNDPSAYDNATAQIRSVRQSLEDANAGKGAAGPWLKSDQQYLELQARIHSIDRSVDSLTRGDGAFARLLESSRLYDSLAGQSKNARTFLHEFRENPQKFLRIKLF